MIAVLTAPPPATTDPSFWQSSVAGSLVTGLVATGVALFTYLGTRRNTDRQLVAQRDSWRRDQILKQIIDYFSTARVVADDAFWLGRQEVVALEDGPRGTPDPEEGLTYTEDELRRYRAALTASANVKRGKEELDKHWQEFRTHVHGASLVLGTASESKTVEDLRAETDQLFGYLQELDPMVSNQEIRIRTRKCKDLRSSLEREVASLLRQKTLP
jgi:hypothetical protein